MAGPYTVADLNDRLYQLNRAVSALQSLADAEALDSIVSALDQAIDGLRSNQGVQDAANATSDPAPASAPSPNSGVRPNVTAQSLPNQGGLSETGGQTVLSPGNELDPNVSGPVPAPGQPAAAPDYPTPQGDDPTPPEGAAPVDVQESDGSDAASGEQAEPVDVNPA